VTAAGGNLIVSVTLQPLAHKKNIVLKAEPGILTMFRQILAGLEALDTEFAFLAEHDVLYPEGYFEFRPPRSDVYYYNTNVWHVDASSGQAISYTAKRTSQLCANRELLVEHYRKRVALVEANGFSMKMGFEPGSHSRAERVDDVTSDVWRCAIPSIDIKHGKNLTPARWAQSQFRDQRNCRDWQTGDGVPGWGKTKGCFSCFLKKLGQPVREEVAV
jgi:hypothetical protein